MKQKYLYYLFAVVLFFLFFVGNGLSADPSLKPWSEDRGYVDGWYCSSSIDKQWGEGSINMNDSPFVHNRDYFCNIGWDPEAGRCLFDVVDCYDCSSRPTHLEWWSVNYEQRQTLTVFQSCVHNDYNDVDWWHFSSEDTSRPAYHWMSNLNFDSSNTWCKLSKK